MTTFKVGDRAIVTGEGGGLHDGHIRHWIVPGTDVEIIADQADDDVVSVQGLANFAHDGGSLDDEVNSQWVHPDDLELFVDTLFAVGDRAGVVRSTVTPTWAPTRADALRDAVAIFAGFGDISAVGLIAVAEWLYTGRVPA